MTDIKATWSGPLVDSKSGEVNDKKLRHILNSNKFFQEIIGVNVEVEPELPVHFTSVCKFVTVQFSNQSAILELELFVKILKQNAEIKEEEEYSLFDKESNIYTGVIPVLQQLCESRTG